MGKATKARRMAEKKAEVIRYTLAVWAWQDKQEEGSATFQNSVSGSLRL